MKSVPTTWEDIRFIEGYPGKYVILARKSAGKWYIVGVNAQEETVQTTIPLKGLIDEKTVRLYSDDTDLNGSVKEVRTGRKNEIEVKIPCNGGFLIE